MQEVGSQSGVTARPCESDPFCINCFCWVFLCLLFHTAPRAGFKLPGYRPSEMDKRFLLWSGRFKSADQIPELVS